MGIQGLLPLLNSIQKPCTLKKFEGQTVGVDAYGWLHRGSIACVMELATGKPTKKFVEFCMRRVRLLQKNGVKPYLVFDGDYLPSKAVTEHEREKKREESKKAGRELERAGKIADARNEYTKAIDVTPEMARQWIDELKKAGVNYIVAPYEADAQLVYLERQGIISAILSDDSDLLVFGAKCLLTKLDEHGGCIEINKSLFCACREVSLTGWSDKEFRHMAILSGCDYLKSIKGMGLKTAYRLVRKYKTIEKVLQTVKFDGKFSVPAGYLESFRQAELTFLHQWVFCPEKKELVFHTAPQQILDATTMPFIGAYVVPEIAQKVACGDINPITKKPIGIIQRSSTNGPSNKENATPNINSSSSTSVSGIQATLNSKPTQNCGPRSQNQRPAPGGVSIDTYFRPKRIPLGEMNPNHFLLTPSQENIMAGGEIINRRMRRPRNVAQAENLVFNPLPHIQLPRAYLYPSEATHIPTHADPPTRSLSRRRSPSPARSSELPAAKRARSCGDGPSSVRSVRSATSPETRSRFFFSTNSVANSDKRRGGRRTKSEVDVFSDDSIDELMAGSWDEIHEAAAKQSAQMGLASIEQGERTESLGQSSNDAMTTPQVPVALSSCSAVQAPPTPADTPAAASSIGKYSFASTPSGPTKIATQHIFVHGLPTPQSEAPKSPLALDLSAANSGKPLGGLQSILHRMAARVLPPAQDSTPFKSLPKKFKVPFPEVARPTHLNDPLGADSASMIPLSPIDNEETTVLLSEDADNIVQLGGSEDSIVHDSEDEEEELSEKPKYDLARFAYSTCF